MRGTTMAACVLAGAALAAALVGPYATTAQAGLPELAYCSDEGGEWDIYLVRADGSGRKNLTRHEGADEMPVWSPDGRQIAFVSDRDGNQEIYVMRADGSRQTNITKTEAFED
ncbi:MAG: TolB family protein, partial [Armatimonadota bacterium]